MYLSLGLIFILGALFNIALRKIKLPPLLGYLITGIVLGPYVFNLIDKSILDISSELRKIALLIILLRAGLSLDLKDLKKVGRPSILMSFVPAIVEMTVVGVVGPLLFNITYLDSFLLGSVLAAVSPAVVVPRMIDMIDNNQGTSKGIPQLVIAGSSLDDVVTIVIFTSLLSIETSSGSDIGVMTFLNIPISIVLGITIGALIGLLLQFIFKKCHIRDSVKVIIILSCAFLFVWFESFLENYVGFSSLIATITLGIVMLFKLPTASKRVAAKFNKLWVVFEILLFVLVGASVDIHYLLENALFSIILLTVALLFRIVGVFICLIKTHLDKKERLFCAIAYLPKATVQAAIGAIPLASGLACGEIVLSVAVMSILFTAPLGAYLIDFSKNKLIVQ